MNVLVIDYGLGNLASVRRAFEECGATVEIADDPVRLEMADRVVLPGVGGFAEGMANLRAAHWPERLRETLANPEIRLLGICLGMQLLAGEGCEGGATSGLGLIPGKVTRLAPAARERIPHVGWNEVVPVGESALLCDLPAATDFYFVHSYHFEPTDESAVLATTPYCGSFASVVGRGNVFGTQFHPEKSSAAGFRLIRNFLAA